ncbi:EF-hand domain-containing protein [Aliiglaciecola lipolytica]|uniref:EF-hand domain-containing protein n=1 Tax=Aliiglaciecola lipolytica E3 TaxID=1127673 RepID=K6YFA8_9ALTE|nr:EF-hand domain-containing protein [Aliiglaciecola lipolytica]GAC15288.1 hypothetical protein GLIP_2663 [Aliiglaciecola lipolytica E3]
MKTFISMGLMFAAVIFLQSMLGTSAYAQTDLIAEMDLDEDGMISIREAVADPNLLAAFGKIDTNGDGKISSDELLEANLSRQIDKKA